MVRSIALVGGGRWSRVLMTVLQSVAPESTKIYWVTQRNTDRAEAWLQDNGIRKIDVVENTPMDLEAAIVANSPFQHATTAQTLIENGIHTLVEKPLALELDDAKRLAALAKSQNVVLGVELVLHYACYANEFARQVAGLNFDRIEMDWHDPWSEERHGEVKLGSVYTYMTHDMLPHCWSLLRLIAPGRIAGDVASVNYTVSATNVTCEHRDLTSVVSLSRRSQRSRVREIRLYQNSEPEPLATLDFSTEPGCSRIGETEITYAWTTDRPLTLSLTSFLDAIEDRENQWPLSAEKCLGSVNYAQQATELLITAQRETLSDIYSQGFDIGNSEHIAAVLDYFVPLQAQSLGIRPEIHTEAQQIAHAAMFSVSDLSRN